MKSVSRIVQGILDGGSFTHLTRRIKDRGEPEDINNWSRRTMLVTLVLLQKQYDFSKVVFNEDWDIIWPTLWQKSVGKAADFAWEKLTQKIDNFSIIYDWIDVWKSEQNPEKRAKAWERVKSLPLEFNQCNRILTYAKSTEELMFAASTLADIAVTEKVA